MRTVATAFAERAKMDWTSRLQMEVAVAAQKLAQAWDGVGYTAEEREQLTQVRGASAWQPTAHDRSLTPPHATYNRGVGRARASRRP